ncbi:MAG: ABC transporter permease, partial [Syntrophothermus sp.]
MMKGTGAGVQRMPITLGLEKRLYPSPLLPYLGPVLSVVLALLLGAAFIEGTGYNAWTVYAVLFTGAFGSVYGLSETVVKAIPLMLCGLGVAVAFRMLLWNIGAEGQLYMGAFAASWLALSFPQAPGYLLLPGMFLAGFLAGALWALLPAIPRALLGVNEVITTLMMNYIAILWVDYLVYGPWKDPKGFNFPLSAPFAEAAWLPSFGATRIHLGLILGLLAALAMYVIL